MTVLRQRAISKLRIMRTFLHRQSLNCREICGLSGLWRSTTSPRLGELVSDGYLTVSRGKDNKTKIYRPTSKCLESESVVLRGSRERRQAVRLQKLGFKPLVVEYPHGRRQRDAMKKLNIASENLRDRIIALYEKGGDQAISPLDKLGLHFKHGEVQGFPVFAFSIRGLALAKLRRTLQVQESRYDLIQS
jgi:hypothetical protein